jgi:integrase
MSVRKRKWTTSLGESKEAWVVDYSDMNGARVQKTFERKKDADAYHDGVRVDVRKGMHVAPSKSATVAAAAEKWIERVEANGMKGEGPVERTTIRQYRQHVDLHIVPRIGNIKLAALTKGGVELFCKSLLMDMSRPLARKVLTSFKSILRVAGYSHVAMDASIGTKRSGKLEVGRDIPAAAEVSRLLKATTDSKRRALIMVVAMTGLRASELRGLRWSDVDLSAGELHVRQRADRYSEIGSPKSESSVRRVPFGSDVSLALKTWKLACPKGELDLVFPTGKGQVEHHKNMLNSLAPLMREAGLMRKDGKPRYALHAFRHFFASWCINPLDRGGRGLPAKVVQELMGHSSITLTMDTYGHLFPDGSDRGELDRATSALLA